MGKWRPIATMTGCTIIGLGFIEAITAIYRPAMATVAQWIFTFVVTFSAIGYTPTKMTRL